MWSGDPTPNMTMMKCQVDEYCCNGTRLDTGMHFGTHLDAAVHFIEGGKSVGELGINVLPGSRQAAVAMAEAILWNWV